MLQQQDAAAAHVLRRPRQTLQKLLPDLHRGGRVLRQAAQASDEGSVQGKCDAERNAAKNMMKEENTKD